MYAVLAGGTELSGEKSEFIWSYRVNVIILDFRVWYENPKALLKKDSVMF